MGDQNVSEGFDERQLGELEQALLADLRALEFLINNDRFETGIRRIGAEQEMVLIDRARRPAPVGQAVMEKAADERIVPELARWNVEANLSPQVFGGTCLRAMEGELLEVVEKVRNAAHEAGAEMVLCGILPTLRLNDLSIDNMTPNPRYYEMNDALRRLRGGQFEINISGIDELSHRHDNIMLESANTSFQVHFQVAPHEFAHLYNLAQLVAAPVLAAAVNSPVFAGRKLWTETRVALFQHAVDSRQTRHRARKHPPRVMFGNDWLEESILEIFHEDISRFRVILGVGEVRDPMKILREGGIPPLKMLCLHNSTVWRWNRACYGSAGEKPHLRIENRILPSGPTVLDEVANSAFYFGLMACIGDEYGPVRKALKFDDAKSNFFAASRQGLKAQFTWVGGKTYTAAELILDHLLPLARKGLEHHKLDPADIDRYLGTVEHRVRSGQTGSQWAVDSLAQMEATGGKGVRDEEKMRALVTGMVHNQQTGEPVHNWPLAKLPEESGEWSMGVQTIAQLMDTDLYTCHPADVVEMVANMMEWKKLRYVLVEDDDDGSLVGIVSQRAILRLIAKGWTPARGSDDALAIEVTDRERPIVVRDIMVKDPYSVTPDTPTLEAMELMQRHQVGCLPVVNDGAAVGIVTAHDFLDVSARLLARHLRDAAPPARATATDSDAGNA